MFTSALAACAAARSPALCNLILKLPETSLSVKTGSFRHQPTSASMSAMLRWCTAMFTAVADHARTGADEQSMLRGVTKYSGERIAAEEPCVYHRRYAYRYHGTPRLPRLSSCLSLPTPEPGDIPRRTPAQRGRACRPPCLPSASTAMTNEGSSSRHRTDT